MALVRFEAEHPRRRLVDMCAYLFGGCSFDLPLSACFFFPNRAFVCTLRRSDLAPFCWMQRGEPATEDCIGVVGQTSL